MKQGFFLVLATLSLAGCTAANVRDLENAGMVTTHADTRPWQEAYRLLNSQMQQCLAVQSPLAASFTVDGQIYDETRLGEIVMTYPSGPFSGRNGYVARVQVRPADAGSTVTVQAVDNAMGRSVAERVPKWLGGMQECR